MTFRIAGALLLTLPALQACAHAPNTSGTAMIATATLQDANGVAMGNMKIIRSGEFARLIVEAQGLSAGNHGVHLHEVGKCDRPTFATAGGHLNPAGRQHGSLNDAGPHIGDLPNLVAQADGQAALDIQLAAVPTELAAALFDADGTAIVIHAGPDDYRTDPSGNSGARIACGVLVAAS